MKQTTNVLLGIFIIIFSSCKIETNKEITDYVDTFIGTGGHGHTYPGASLPFGMVQLSPDTRIEGWDGCSGYHYSDNIVYGFSHTHLSGTGVGDYCDILFMPQLGGAKFNSGYETNVDNGYASRFSKKNEKTSPGYYSTYLDDYNIKVELTSSKRVGFHKYTYPKNKQQSIIIDLTHRDEVLESSIKIINDSTIAGMRKSRSWAQNQYIYFYARFSKKIINYKIALNDTIQENISEANNKNIKLIVNFDPTSTNTILSKVAISSVSIAGAKNNLGSEIQEWDFENIRKQAKKTWEKELQKIEIEGTKKQKTIFYTSLYHSLLIPNLFMDMDGKYRGTGLKIHQANDFTNYTIFSLWDTYRATHPLFTIIEQKRTSDFIKTFLNQYKNGGQLPVWELAGNYTGCMIGYHSIPVIADAYVKGIRDFDINLAYNAMKHSAMQKHLGLDSYKKYGFIPGHLEHESVSKTLEYAYDDWCIATIAKDLNKTQDNKIFTKRAQSYKNIFDTKTGFMRAKNYGLWKYPFNPSEVDFNYTEANSWQYSFYVPQDVSGLIKLLGGNTNFVNKLDSLFLANPQTKGRTQADITGLIGQYAHGNEPSHHIAYLYNFAQKPWKTQEKVNKILNTLYTNKPDGLCGNEDCGQMSSWYILSSLGFYPVTPGSNIYIIGLPIHKKASINLENGNTFVIKSNYT
jgi:predicted alpha-1,2-mannosidase